MLLLLLATALSCPDDQIIGLELKPWRAALLKDAPGSQEQRAEMAALRMRTVPEGTESEAACIETPVVEGVDIFDANLTGHRDKLVQVRFRFCKGTPDEWQSLRVAVLMPLGSDRHCLLGGEDLGVDQSARNKPCENAGKLPRTIAFREIVQRGRNVVEARDQQGSCEPGQEMSAVTMTLYEAQGVALKKIFETPILDAHATGSGAQLIQRYTVSYGAGAPPKPIAVQRCTQGVPACDSQEFIYAKAGAKYVSR